MKNVFVQTGLVLALSSVLLSCHAEKKNDPLVRVKFAGLRSSTYGIRPFPDTNGWDAYGKKMESLYSGSTGCFVWIVGYVTGNSGKRSCTINFPLSKKVEGVNSFPIDENEDFLKMCDTKGYAVWLQVEPGDCDLPSLAEETMKRYKHHPSVKGFGIDVEWYKPEGTDGAGVAITDELAKEIDHRIKAINPDFNYFLKHWDERWMPPTYRADIVFVNDSQMHESLESMQGEFSTWAAKFYPNPVMFQIGYEADKDLWSTYSNPMKELGDYLVLPLAKDQSVGIVWVDFSLRKTMEAQGLIVK